jgi:hypothetical protein
LNLWDLGPRSGLAAGRSASAIDRALALWRRGDASEARDALVRAMSTLPDEPGRWIELGRLLKVVGGSAESATALARAGAILERQLARSCDLAELEATAADLAASLPDAGGSADWTVLRPTVMTSVAGSALTCLPDGSVLADGLNPAFDVYTIEAVSGVSPITGLRLEALPDPSLPRLGPGRFPGNGNFLLDAIRTSVVAEPGGPTDCRVSLIRARADYADQTNGFQGVMGALDANLRTAWSITPQFGRAHQAVFQPAEPIGTSAGTRLRVELSFQTKGFPQRTLGRFRLSVTDRPSPFLESSLGAIKADKARNGLTRLGAAYTLRSEWAPAALVLERAVARPDCCALDELLLALARHHTGRAKEARAGCDRALDRLKTEWTENATRDVAVEALTLIRGLGPGAAESFLLDFTLPADPFAP